MSKLGFGSINNIHVGFKDLSIVESHGLDNTSERNVLRLTSLPSDTLLDIMSYVDSFKDLNAFINSSAPVYRAFTIHPNLVFTGVARNILGDAFDDATTVLVWQRNSLSIDGKPNYTAVNEDLQQKFILYRKDIPILQANQRFFRASNQRFSNFRDELFVRQRGSSTRRFLTARWSLSDSLPITYFYEMWLLHIRFRHETIETFASREPSSAQHYLDLERVSQTIFRSRDICINLVVSPLPRWDGYEGKEEIYRMRTLFGTWTPDIYIKNDEETGKRDNPLLKLKMLCHLASTLKRSDIYPAVLWNSRPLPGYGNWFQEAFRGVRDRFLVDYERKSVKALVEEYNLSSNLPWEIQLPVRQR